MGSGLGGSAASAVAAVVAGNEFLDSPLPKKQLVQHCLAGEKIASGALHGDNIIPALYGGLCFINSLDPLEVIELPVPKIFTVNFYPHITIKTSESRDALPENIALNKQIMQNSRLAGFICGIYANDLKLISENLKDDIVEPIRATAIPGFDEAKKVALSCGAIGFGVSGSGPALYCWCEKIDTAKQIEQKVNEILKKHGEVDSWIGRINKMGTQIL